MKVFILTEAGINYGLGHLSRCLALYDAFSVIGLDVYIIINGDTSINNILIEYNFLIINWLIEERYIEKIKIDDIIIIDSYNLNEKIFNVLSLLCRKVVLIDDNNLYNYKKILFLVNTNIYANKLNYYNSKVNYLLGTNYFLLRKDFWNQTKKKIKPDKKLLMVFGGSELAIGISKKVYKIVSKNFPELKKLVIIPNSVNNGALEIDPNTRLYFSPEFKEMYNIMLEADIAITASGQTLYELMCLGIPSIICSIVNNQYLNMVSIQEERLALSIGSIEHTDNISSESLVDKLNLLLNDKILYKKLSLNGQKFIDGKGAIRVAKYLSTEIEK